MPERTDDSNYLHAVATIDVNADIPDHVRLSKKDLPFWESVLHEFARSEWTSHQIELAAMLARAMADMELDQRQLRDEGMIIETPNGTKKPNPRNQSLKGTAALILSMRRSLSLTARERNDTRTIANRRSKERSIQEILDDDDEGLLAQPSTEE
jgi:Phage terminase, small subunit